MHVMFAVLFFATLIVGPAASRLPQAPVALPGGQSQADDYTRYELLAPDSASFRITYDVTATAPGARVFFNVIRKGSEASDESVIDVMSGATLPFDIVAGAEARTAGLAGADPAAQYIRVRLPRPVPANGEVRLRILKTYKDPASYFREGAAIVFSRSLSIKRNSIVLPPGFSLVECNVASQIATEPDGRLRVSFINETPVAMPVLVKARPAARPASPRPSTAVPPLPAGDSVAAAPVRPSAAARLAERARETREIVYFLHAPDTHAFSLYHDYTEAREGSDRYLNVVRQGSTVSNPSAHLLDSGETLPCEILRGDAVIRAGLDIGEPVRPDTEVVVVRFPAVRKGQTLRLRIEETYTDPGRYRLAGDELEWDRSLSRPFNAVVLPAGWTPTASSIPAAVSQTPDGRTRLDYVNARPDEISVLLRARRDAR